MIISDPGSSLEGKVEISPAHGLDKISTECSLGHSVLSLKEGIVVLEQTFQFLPTTGETEFGI